MLRDINGVSAKETAKIILQCAVFGWWKSEDVHSYLQDIFYSLKDIISYLIRLSCLVFGRLLLFVTLPISFFVVFVLLRYLQKKQEENKILKTLKSK